ncbi:MAG: hypothetical protein M1834_002290 [Cirrosporium novae-zelandiae]|nr:MAG: hypothetical protein M1834_002290 [Cirrosporium novae-zelandiae]
MEGSGASGAAVRRSHGRMTSSEDRRRSGQVRTSRVARGPLDMDDPLDNSSALPASRTQSPAPSSTPLSPTSPGPRTPEEALLNLERPYRDFSYLLQPEIYHPLSKLKAHPAFRTSPNAPSPAADIPYLLSHGHYRAAATKAAYLLTTPSTPPLDATQIFQLLYTRLACLLIVSSPTIPAEETKILSDLSSTFYQDPFTNTHLVPWALRVLAVRLQGIGFSDSRRAIMGYYDLGREARAEAAKATSEEDKRRWKERLADLGVRVANALVEMGDLEGALRHLRTLHPDDGHDSLRQWLALLSLKIGDVEAAKKYLKRSDEVDAVHDDVVAPLISMADGNFDQAAQEWASLGKIPGNENNAMVAQNQAVCLLYGGKVNEAHSLLNSLLGSTTVPFPTLIFNVSTLYDLCYRDSTAKKEELAAKIAAKTPREEGWERDWEDFKLERPRGSGEGHLGESRA